MLITAGIISFTPFISSYAAINDQYNWNYSSENITQTDLSSYFKNYEGSFVLFNSNRDSWTVYDMEHATHRISPDSTYKIYDALWGLLHHKTPYLYGMEKTILLKPGILI